MILKITKIFLNLLLLVLILDPSDKILHLKIPLFAGLFLLWFTHKAFSKQPIAFNKDILLICFLMIIIPLLSITSAIIQNNLDNTETPFAVIKSFIFFLLIIVVYDLQFPFYNQFNQYLIILSFLIIGLYFTFLINPSLFGNIAFYLVDIKDEAAFATRNYYGITVIMIYYKTSALLVFPMALQLNKFYQNKKFVNLLAAAICFGSLFLSGTRGNIIAAVFVLLLVLFYNLISKRKFIKIFFYVTIFFVSGFIFISGLSFGDRDESQDIKSGHMKGYIEVFKNNPETYITGQGLGSDFFSYGVQQKISHSELTYIDLVRIFGIPLTFIIIFVLLYPIVYLYKSRQVVNNVAAISAYYGYLFIIGTNPLFLSSTGIAVVVVMYSLIQNKSYRTSDNLELISAK